MTDEWTPHDHLVTIETTPDGLWCNYTTIISPQKGVKIADVEYWEVMFRRTYWGLAKFRELEQAPDKLGSLKVLIKSSGPDWSDIIRDYLCGKLKL